MDRASFDSAPAILSRYCNCALRCSILSVAHSSCRVTSDGTASETDGGSRGIEFLRLFPRFFSPGQDALRENPNIFKSISVVMPIASADVVSPIQGQSHFVRLFPLQVARHAINLAKEIEHDVQRNSAPGTRINFGA
jgi:hypothetical protein